MTAGNTEYRVSGGLRVGNEEVIVLSKTFEIKSTLPSAFEIFPPSGNWLAMLKNRRVARSHQFN